MDDKKLCTITIADCAEKPKFWDDDMKMDAWFAPFRNRDVNPLNYDNKLNFWKNNVNFFCEKTHKCSFTLMQLKSFFVRNGKTPSCLPLVFETMLKEGAIQELSEFEKCLANKTWTGWAVNKFVSNPLKWLSKKVITSVNSSAEEIEETTQFVHLPSLKKHADELHKCITKEVKDSIVTFEKVKDIYSKSLGMNIDLNIVKLLVRCLQFEDKADVVFEDKHCHENLVKFSVNLQPVVPISDSEISVYVLLMRERMLSNRLQQLETEEKSLRTEVKTYLKQGQKITARNTLRKKKEIEKRIDKVVKILENVQTLLYKVEETESDSQILDSYRVGAHALKSGLTKGGLNFSNVDNAMDEIEEILNMHADVQETLGQVVGPQPNDAELESELSELLLDDMPSVPPGPLSPGRKAKDFKIDDLPDVPKNLPQTPTQNRIEL